MLQVVCFTKLCFIRLGLFGVVILRKNKFETSGVMFQILRDKMWGLEKNFPCRLTLAKNWL